MVGEFTWSELLLKPVEFEFGPTLANESEKPQIKYVAAKRFHANFEPQPRRMFPQVDLSQYIVQLAISSAIFVKKSSIPDRITDVTETVVEFTTIMDQHYAIKEKVKRIGHVFVDIWVGLVSTFVAAILQAMIAYHNTPGNNPMEKKMLEIDSRVKSTVHNDACLVTFCVGGLTFTTQLKHLVSRKRTLLGRLVFNRKSVESTVFIDRDGQHFRHILNHLRGLDTVSHIKSIDVLEDLFLEAKYYELNDLVDSIIQLQTRLNNLEPQE